MKAIKGFDKRLQNAIFAKNMTIDDVAIKTKISRSCLYGYIYQSKMPYCLNLVKLSRELEVSTDYLLGLKEG